MAIKKEVKKDNKFGIKYTDESYTTAMKLANAIDKLVDEVAVLKKEISTLKKGK